MRTAPPGTRFQSLVLCSCSSPPDTCTPLPSRDPQGQGRGLAPPGPSPSQAPELGGVLGRLLRDLGFLNCSPTYVCNRSCNSRKCWFYILLTLRNHSPSSTLLGTRRSFPRSDSSAAVLASVPRTLVLSKYFLKEYTLPSAWRTLLTFLRSRML